MQLAETRSWSNLRGKFHGSCFMTAHSTLICLLFWQAVALQPQRVLIPALEWDTALGNPVFEAAPTST